jgi:xylulokinase
MTQAPEPGEESIYLIGVDLGTSGTKTAIFDANGTLVAEAFEETPLHYPRPGWVEQDPDDFYAGALRTIQACLEKGNVEPGKVAALAFSGQMAGVCSVDDGWETPTRYDSWLDSRCAPYMISMKEQQRRIIELTGGYPTYSHGPKILWWLRERPEVSRHVNKFVMPAAYVAGRMANLRGEEAFIDHSYLHFTCLSDTAQSEWSQELCEQFDVPLDKLPRIVKPWEVVGKVGREAAEACGLLEGTPIAAGAGDTVAGMLGAGLVEPGMALDVAGTAAVFAVCLEAFRPDTEKETLFTGRLVSEDLWFAYAYINGGGLNLRWFRDRWAGGANSAYGQLDAEAAAVPPGADGLFFLPHLGGRVCPNDPMQRGLWAGFSWSHDRAHFYRSLLEGVAYEYAHYLRIEQALFPEARFSEVRVIGGGARSQVWNAIKADVLGLPYVQLAQQECTVLGAAIIAGRAAGVFDDVKEAARRFNRATGRVAPDDERHRFYASAVDVYVELLEAMTPRFQRLENLPKPPQERGE